MTSSLPASGPPAAAARPRRRYLPPRGTRIAASPTGPADGDSLADVVERMFAVFESQLSLSTIVRVVRRCRRELDIAPGPPVAGRLEERARQRLTDLAVLQGASLAP